MRTWTPALYALAGCAVLTWLDSGCFFFVFPRPLFAIVLLLPLVPRKRGSSGKRPTVPLTLSGLWMLALPFLPTGATKGFFLAAERIERGMTATEVRARMDAYLEIPSEYDWPADEVWAWPAARHGVLVFLSSLESGQVCEVFMDEGRVTRVVAEYAD